MKTPWFLFLLLLSVLVPLRTPAYNFGEHQVIGDRGFTRFTRWLVAQRSLNNYAADVRWWQQHAGLVYDSLPQRHVFRSLSLGNNRVGYGTLNGLAGDHAENPLVLEEGLHYAQSRLHQVIELHQRALLESRSAAADPDLVRIDDQYLPLALNNFSHFFAYGRPFAWHFNAFDRSLLDQGLQPAQLGACFQQLTHTNVLNMYASVHTMALLLAERAGRLAEKEPAQAERYLSYALLYNAFADHFLEDCFAAGHMVVNRKWLGSFTNNHSLHDLYNRQGAEVANLRGETWRAYGDGAFNQTHAQWRHAPDLASVEYQEFTPEANRVIEAVSLSLQDVWTAFHAARQGETSSVATALPAQHDQLAAYFRQRYPALALVPIPFNTPVEKYLPAAGNLTDLRTRTQMLNDRPFHLSRMGNSLAFGAAFLSIPLDKLPLYYTEQELRFNIAPFVYQHGYNPVNGTGQLRNYQVRPTMAFTWGEFTDLNADQSVARRAYSVKGGISANLDYWVSPTRFMGLYSYLQIGAYREQGRPIQFLFAPAVGVQPGALLGIRYYELPVWLRWPAQLAHSLRIRGNVQYLPRRSPLIFLSAEVDLFY
jgi:hypothetical protein